MEKITLGVRKGSWTKEEDILLKKCIEKYGEGRWHLVPLRAGLNRCRKSCRLRWLNYLDPNVKRGLFTSDEVDLILRMHKLLGNKWTLIAGRIPGRTANDVKNFWNTRIQKRSSTFAEENHLGNNVTITKSNIMRPRPRNFSQKLQEKPTPRPSIQATSQTNQKIDDKNYDHFQSNSTENEILMNMHGLDHDHLVAEQEEEDEEEECMRWWSKLLEISEVPFSFPEDEDHQPIILSPGTCNQANNHANIDGEGLNDFDLEVDVAEFEDNNNQ